MASPLWLPSTRVTQPQGAVGVNWSNPFARGLQLLLAPKTAGLNAVANQFQISGVAGASSLVTTTTGIGISGNGNTSAQWNVSGNPAVGIGTGDFAFLFIVNKRNTDSGFIISDDGSNNLLYTSGANDYYSYLSGLHGPTYTLNKDQVVLWTRKAGVEYIYVDGAVVSAASTASFPAGTNQHILCRLNSTDFFQTASISFYAAWGSNRGFSPSEAQLLIANPWQLFEDEQTYLPFGTAALYPTLSNMRFNPATSSGGYFAVDLS